MAKSKISWTEETWNPIVGCSIISKGCRNCYAMQMAARLQCMSDKNPHYNGTTHYVNGKSVWTGKLAQAPESTLMKPLKRKKPTMYFVNSMSDLFHEDVSDAWIDQVFAVMALCPQHTFQILTKRAQRMHEYLVCKNGVGNADICKAINDIPYPLGNRHGALFMPLANVWLGVSAEDQEQHDLRTKYLRHTPAAIRFISFEPQLEDIVANLHNIDLAIVGCESGPGARASNLNWARSLRFQCREAGTIFHLKQTIDENGKLDRSQFLDGVKHDEMPKVVL